MTAPLPWTRIDDLRLIRWTKACVPVGEIATRLGRTYGSVITRRMKLHDAGKLKRLGYAGHRSWTYGEVFALQELVAEGKSVKWLAAHFRRTPTAIELKIKRVCGLLRSTRQTLSSRDIARIMGLGCSKTVVTWVERGWLTPVPGRVTKGTWRFEEFCLWSFVENPETHMAWEVKRITDPDLQAHALEHRVKHPRWLTMGEVARRYHVARGTVYQWITKQKVIPYDMVYKYDNHYIREDALEGFVMPSERPRDGARYSYPRCLGGQRRLPDDVWFTIERWEHLCDDCRRREVGMVARRRPPKARSFSNAFDRSKRRHAECQDTTEHQEGPCDDLQPARTNGMTPREEAVLCEVALGYTDAAVSQRLGVGRQTIRTHVGNILGKLNLSSRTQLAVYAIAAGMVSRDALLEALDEHRKRKDG